MVAIFTGAGTGFERGSGSVVGGAGLLGSATLGRGGEKLFLNAATGNLLINRQDEFLMGRGPDVAIGRTYNSLGAMVDDNGDNWLQSTDRRIFGLTGSLNTAGSTIKRRSGDGSEITYAWDGSAYVTTDGSGAHDKLTYNPAGAQWTWTDGDTQFKEVYTPYLSEWRIFKHFDTGGNALTFSYTGANLTRITTQNAEYTDYVWSGPNITQIVTGYNQGGVAKTLTRTRYAYDGFNRLTSVTVDESPEDNSVADGNAYVTSYTYHGSSKLVATIAQTDGSLVSIGYDGSNRVTSLAQTVASGVTRTTAIAYGTGYTDVTDPSGQVMRLEYNADGSLKKVIAPPAHAGVAAQTVQFGYNANGDLISVTDAAGDVVSYTHDGSGNVLTVTDRLGNVVTRTYGAKNEVLTEAYADTPLFVANGTNASAVVQSDGMYRITKTAGGNGWNAQTQSTEAVQGDFVLRVRPVQNNKSILLGVSSNPHVTPSYTDIGYSIFTANDGTLYAHENGVNHVLGTYAAGDNMWMVRTGDTIRYYKGATLEAAKQAGALRTVTGASGSFYFDSSVFTQSAQADVSLTPIAVNRYVYDTGNRVVAQVSAEGHVTQHSYTHNGLLLSTLTTPDHFYDVAALAASDIITKAQIDSWYAAIADKSTVERVAYAYGARGEITHRTAYGAATAAGEISTVLGTSLSSYVYDQAGQLLARAANGYNSETYVYDGLGRVTASVDVKGASTTVVFDDAATTTTVTVAGDLVQTSVYNKAGDLLSYQEAGTGVTGGTATYTYDTLGRVRSVTDATQRVTYFIYDKVGRKVAEVAQIGTSPSRTGEITEYRYDSRNRIVATTRYAAVLNDAAIATLANTSSSIDMGTFRPTANTADLWTWTVYDDEGRVVQAIDGDGSVTTYAYDASSRLVATTAYTNRLSAAQIAGFKANAPTVATLPVVHANDSVARVFYDKDGRTVGALDGNGYLTRTVYDKAGRVVQEIAYANASNAAHRAAGSFQALLNGAGASGNDRSVRYVYDGQGFLRFTIDNLNQVIEHVYEVSANSPHTHGDVRRTIVYAGAIGTPASYTVAGVRDAITAAGLASHADNRSSWTIYDTAGRVAYTIDAIGSVVGYEYNALGQVTKAIAFAAPRATTSVPGKPTMDVWKNGIIASTANRVTRNFYNAAGQLRFTIDGEGFVSESAYDAEGRVTSTTRWSAAVSAVDGWTLADVIAAAKGTGVVTGMAYDHLGRVSTVTDAIGTVTRNSYTATGLLLETTVAYGTSDAATTRYGYDATGRTISRTDAYGTAEAATTQFAFDGLGNLVSTTDARNNITTFTYDKLGRVLTQTNALSGVVTQEYNAFGDNVRTIDERLNSTWRYFDKLGRIVSVRDAENYVTETSYTTFGDIAAVTRRYYKATNAASASVLPVYTADSDKDATTSFQYDRLSRVVRSTDALDNFEEYTLNSFGDRVTVRNKLGGITTNTFDRRGLLTQESIAVSGNYASTIGVQSTTIVNTFAYDARGNLISTVEAAGATEARTTTYAYDSLNRLTSKTGMAVATGLAGTSITPSEVYTYDRRGNLIQTVDANGARTLFYYDDLDRKVVQINAVGAVVAYGYDATGNLVNTRAYDTMVALPSTPGGTVTLPAGTNRETTYVYDALNRLTTSYVRAQTTGRWDGSVFATRTDELFTHYEYDATGNVIKTTDPNSNAAFSYYDKLGRKTAQVDQERYLTAWTLDAEGNVLTERRYATQADTPSTTAPPTVATNGADRFTQFSYDTMGRRLNEIRTGVAAYTISNLTTGALGSTPTSAIVTYIYNALGQVVWKSEANGDITTYTYDNAGRLIVEKRPSFTDHTGVTPSPTVRYFYDRLDQLTSTHQGAYETAVDDRITTNVYTAGRLTSTIDAAGFVRTYRYDAAGRVVAESYARVLSSGSAVSEAVFYVHDAVGQIITQTFARHNGTSWVHTNAAGQAYDATRLRYNAHGELTGRGITAGPAATAVYQEFYSYDVAGRVWRTNAGDGVVRFHLYDKVGNQTLTLASTGTTDIMGLTYEQLVESIAYDSNSSLSGVAVTFNIYDKRGMAIATREPDRQLSATGSVVTLTRSRTYNAYGEVASETDARGYTTTFAYNTMGRLTRIERPTVSITLENGTAIWVKPSEDNYYDISGRLIGTRDANGSYATNGTAINGATKAVNTGNLTSRLLLAGSGHGGSEALTANEFHADGGVFQTLYDKFGDARILRNELYTGSNATQTDELYSYDGMGRVTAITRRGGQLIDRYEYDGLGQRIRHWIEEVGPSTIAGISAYVEKTDYDAQGRIVSAVAMGGDTTTTSYVWNPASATIGGWTETTTYQGGHTTSRVSSMFGRVVQETDFAGRVFSSYYDFGGRITSRVAQNVDGGTQNYSWLNTGLIGSVRSGTTLSGEFEEKLVTTYGYEERGQRTLERIDKSDGHWQWGYYYWPDDGVWDNGYQWVATITPLQNATASYDALGRMTHWAEAGTSTLPAAQTDNKYDAVGNVRMTSFTAATLSASGSVSGSSTASHWYRYDNMNRVVTSKGELSGGQIVRGGAGTDYLYDKADNRTQALWTVERTVSIQNPDFHDPHWDEPYIPYSYTAVLREDYSYDPRGLLSAVLIAESSYSDNGDGTVTVTAPTSSGAVRARYGYDVVGRLQYQLDYLVDGSAWSTPNYPYFNNVPYSAVAYARLVTYNAKSQVEHEQQVVRQQVGANRIETDYNYGSGAGYMLGSVVSSTAQTWRDNNLVSTATTANSYGWYGAAQVATTTITTNVVGGSTSSASTNYTYDGAGVLQLADINDGRPRDVTFVNDAEGRVIARDEADANTSQGDPHERWYRFAGREIGMVGNNGTLESNYAASIARRAQPPQSGPFLGGSTWGASVTEFDQGPDPLTSYHQGGSGGGYEVRAGDSLQSIAAQLWGDASLWYKLAEANGLTVASALAPGRILSVPAGVQRSTHNTGTFAPYNPAETLGDTSPTTPTPQAQKKNKCGVLGAILLAVVAVAVVIATKGAATKFAASILGVGTKSAGAAIVGGALAGAAGSVVSQGVGLATGIQDKFNWGGVAMAAIGGGIGGGLGASGLFGKTVDGAFAVGKLGIQSSTVASALQGVAGNLLTQGVAVATGLQSKFDFAGVAAAGIGSFASSPIKGGKFGATFGRSAADGLASAATRSLLTGTSFGDNIIAVLPSVIGRTVGGMIEQVVSGAKDTSGTPAHQSDGPAISLPMPGTVGIDPRAMFVGAMAGTQLALDQISAAAAAAPTDDDTEIVIIGRSSGNRPGTVSVTAGTVAGAGGSSGYAKLAEAGYALDYRTLAARRSALDSFFKAYPGHVDEAKARAALDRNAELIDQWNAMADAALGAVAYDILVEKGSYIPNPIGALANGYKLGAGIFNGTVAPDPTSIALDLALNRVKPLRVLGGAAERAPLFSSAGGELAGVERASQPLLDAVGGKRAVTWATPGSDAERFLNMRGAEAAAFGPEDILLRPNPSKAAVLEEFLHGTQQRLGVVDRLGTSGMGSAETHVKDFMVRHQNMLGLSAEDVRRIQMLKDMGL